jgi:hypothetical protein
MYRSFVVENQSFTYTLACPYNVTSFLIKNTHNDRVSVDLCCY